MKTIITRSTLLIVLFAFISAGIIHCNKTQDGIKQQENTELDPSIDYITLQVENQADQHAFIIRPHDYAENPNKQYPLLLLFSGATEARQQPESAVYGWVRDYELLAGLQHLREAPLEKSDFKQLVSDQALQVYNQRLEEHPFQEMIIVTPSTHPYRLTDKAHWYETMITEQIIPYCVENYRVDPSRIGVHGVSLGGALSLYLGMRHPDIFTWIGALQPACQSYFNLFDSILKANKNAFQDHSFHIVTSTGDMGLKPAAYSMHELLTSHGIQVDFAEVMGPHDYIFNQGPGLMEMLIQANDVWQK